MHILQPYILVDTGISSDFFPAVQTIVLQLTKESNNTIKEVGIDETQGILRFSIYYINGAYQEQTYKPVGGFFLSRVD